MCGICGIVARSGFPDPEAERGQLETMLQSLAHRGPDAVGRSVGDAAVLGATRLAIRGLEDAAQPITDAESGVVAVCNGEIDNHRELRRWLEDRGQPVLRATDVAVIPGMYLALGEEFAGRLIGAFAVAVWDPRSRRLILARDRAGERPLFFSWNEGEVLFATEIAALATHTRFRPYLNRAAIRQYLQFGIFPAPDTPFAEIHKVAPGESICFDQNGLRRTRYWRWQVQEAPKRPPSLDAFDRIFRAAVGRQSDVDVDFGVFLSGGIDSSLVAAVARALHPDRPLKAYTLRFEEHSFDEGDFASAVARQLRLDPVAVWVRPAEVRSEMQLLVRLVGEPLADPAWLPAALLARRAAQDAPLALVGEGADELFGGYPTYIGAGLADRFARLPAWMRSVFQRALEAVPPSDRKMTVSFLLKRFVQGAALRGIDRHRLWVSNIAPTLLSRLGLEPAEWAEEETGAGSLLDRLQRWDLETLLAEGLLTKADRASMSSALELRAPFLDEAVMAFAATIPVEQRVRGLTTKVFLKRYALRYLPKSIVHRRKRGLSVPIGRWLRGPLNEWAVASLGSGRLEQAGVRTAAALDLFAEHCQRKADHARALWTLLVLSEWLEWAGAGTAKPSVNPARLTEAR
jgi:asparagine synthase (glutamine-hydrolysing)